MEDAYQYQLSVVAGELVATSAQRNKTIRRIINCKKRESRVVIYNGRRTKAWRVPGTPEHGNVAMWSYQLTAE